MNLPQHELKALAIELNAAMPPACVDLATECAELRSIAQLAYAKIDAALHVLYRSQEALGNSEQASTLALATWAIADAHKLLGAP